MFISWTNVAGGDWSVGANWSTGTVPTSGDEAAIDGSGTFTITSSQNESVAALIFDDPSATLALSSPLQVGSPISLDQGTVTLDGGTLIAFALGSLHGQLNTAEPVTIGANT